MSAVIPAGAVSFHLGRLAAVLGRHAEAGAHLARALTMHERQRAPHWIARTRQESEAVQKARS
jgi:hypothetical protein